MGHLVLLLLGFRVGTAAGWLLILALIALISFVLWILNFRRARVVADTPTSRVGSAPQGYVELHGVARTHPGNVLVGPLTATACVWFRFQVEEKRDQPLPTFDQVKEAIIAQLVQAKAQEVVTGLRDAEVGS